MGRLENLEKAKAKLAELKAAGVEVSTARPERAKTVRLYFRQHHGVDENRGSIVQILRDDANRDFKLAQDRAKQVGWPAVVSEMCWKCECGDDDPGAGQRIADCKAPHCAIHPVRPKTPILRPPTLPDPY
jgi:hypothetical protein